MEASCPQVFNLINISAFEQNKLRICFRVLNLFIWAADLFTTSRLPPLLQTEWDVRIPLDVTAPAGWTSNLSVPQVNHFYVGASVAPVETWDQLRSLFFFFPLLWGLQVVTPNKPNSVMCVCGRAGWVAPLAQGGCEDSHKSERRLQTAGASL